MRLIRVKILKNECIENVSIVILLNHLSYNCPKVKKESEHARPSNSEVQTCSVITQKVLHLKDITLGEKTISALMDTGTSVSLIHEDASSKTVDQQKFSNKCIVLSGISKSQVLTKVSFEHNFFIDEDHYSLTWHVVPTKHLNFEAVIGVDILKQASLNLTQNGVEFHKHEEKAWLMQISELHLEDELDFNHILDSQIKMICQG
ncbi:retrovirus-related Pol polyprotein from transposon 17.6 [Nephila pilipes]|uniref:Retrovirus-related Pol polyprotein from transposon 17.6 n=1 Tax=Nephila pilipes TaxID=299642 RepID=A0A8X6ISB6_NEPPI|nr:retrovirus-related Pol polyprotein from transposon 17.6 [Nephila pilipes]